MKMILAAALYLTVTASAAPDNNSFGAALTLKKPVSLAQAMAAHSGKSGKELLVEGQAAKVCQKKGCWMILIDGESEVRITFKDYKFFIPKNSSGKRVRAQGVLKLEEMSVKDAKHYLKDEGASKEEIAKVKAPVKTWTFVASGVELFPSSL